MAAPALDGFDLRARVPAYLRATLTQVTPFYVLEKAGGFAESDARGGAFVTARLAAGASELRDLSILAWRHSADDAIGWPAVKVNEVEAGTADPSAGHVRRGLIGRSRRSPDGPGLAAACGGAGGRGCAGLSTAAGDPPRPARQLVQPGPDGAPVRAVRGGVEGLCRGVETRHLRPEEKPGRTAALIDADDLGRPDLAQTDLEAALAAAPDWLPALLNLGNLHEDMGRREAAAAAYARALAVAPGHPVALARSAGLGASDRAGRSGDRRAAGGGGPAGSARQRPGGAGLCARPRAGSGRRL